jgi:hypothetical protein
MSLDDVFILAPMMSHFSRNAPDLPRDGSRAEHRATAMNAHDALEQVRADIFDVFPPGPQREVWLAWLAQLAQLAQLAADWERVGLTSTLSGAERPRPAHDYLSSFNAASPCGPPNSDVGSVLPSRSIAFSNQCRALC